MRIQSVEKFIFMYKKILKYRKNFEKGIYRINKNMRTFVKNNDDLVLWPSAPNSRRQKLAFKVLKLFPVFILKSGRAFNGSAVYFANNPDIEKADMKIFDFKKKQILTICPSYERFKMVIEQKMNAKEYFPVPELYECDDEALSYLEQFKKHDDDNKNCDKLFDDVFQWYMTYYFNSEVIKKQRIRFDDINIPMYFQHGDLSEDNVIISNGLFFIDFDKPGMYPIFYDLFYLALNIAVNKDEFKYINELLVGAKGKEMTDALVKIGGLTIQMCAEEFIKTFKKRWVENLPEIHQKNYEKLFDEMRKDF